MNISLAKVVSPSVNFNVRLETDEGGKPSGELVDPNASATIDPATLTTSLVDTELNFAGAPENNAHGVTLDSTQATQTAYKGVKITLTSQCDVITIVKDSECTATKVYLYNSSYEYLTSASFSTDTATLNYDGLISGQTYYVVA